MNNYLKYRGRCRELAEQAAAGNPDLELVRGYYYCPIWNKTEQHWWTENTAGEIYDPSRLQFPSAGAGEYQKFDGFVECCICGTKKPENEMDINGKYATCYGECFRKLVM